MPHIRKARQETSISVPPRPVSLQADPECIAQVLQNLLNNASNYTSAGGRIRLTVEPTEDDVVVSVEDDGIGIAPDQLPFVFDLFSQGRSAPGEAQAGLGIGLSLTQNLVQMHEGRIEAASEGLGKGSVFRVHLPTAPSNAGTHADAGSTGTPRRILVVDDSVDAAESLALLCCYAPPVTR